ncbi:F-box/kelch-repeat protein At3g23880-like [Lotus japonicus]|uniref:F-box/kelch-repeat protein At3g23880-like n=1 Tax=Lotus japonicus TaxID=34305 RepID=UPI002586AFF3|nr:F-box/kelch-repeat protein At3g23880-like [Lotus japonicus]
MEIVTDVFPSELVIEILSWLPVLSLIRFKCVCKSWKSLISHNKAFAKLQLERTSLKINHVILTSSDSSFIPCSLPRLLEEPSSIMDQDQDRCLRLDKFEYNEVIGSCNGLICLHADYCAPGFCFRPCNPSTRLRFDKSPPLASMGSSLNFGFGYDVSCDTYKVVVVVSQLRLRGLRLCKTMLHSIGDTCWREILSVPDVPIEFRQINGLFVGGCVNWLANKFEPFEQLVIVSLDMRQEAYRLLSLPQGTSELPSAEIQVLGNCLCLFYDFKRTHFVAWKMSEYGVPESWTPLLTISYEHLRWDHRFYLNQWLICLCGDGHIFMLAKKQKLVIIYNLSDNSVKYVELASNKLWLDANDYVESLVSPC